MRILLFDFLNAYPYQAALEEAGLPYQLLPDPRQVTEAWKRDRPDAALLPLPAVLHEPESWLEWGIGSAGAVQSVLLASEIPPEQWHTIEVDTRSTASVALVRWLMTRGALPSRPLVEKATGPHGRLLIGDRALRLRRAFPVVLDLGELAVRVAGLPVAFAVWWVRPALREKLAALWKAYVPNFQKAPFAAARYRFPLSEVSAYWKGLLYALPYSVLEVWAAHYRPYALDRR